MKYAKLIDNYPHYAPKMLVQNDTKVFNPPDGLCIAHGYLPVITTDSPTTDDKHYAIPSWKEETGQIVQEWSVEEIPDEATESDYITALQDLGVEVN
jgi:hypothetical protein